MYMIIFVRHEEYNVDIDVPKWDNCGPVERKEIFNLVHNFMALDLL